MQSANVNTKMGLDDTGRFNILNYFLRAKGRLPNFYQRFQHQCSPNNEHLQKTRGNLP
jgi:hypothetical protein